MNRTLNVWIKTLFTASGFALAGPSGALIGKVAGGLLATVLPGASGFVGDIVSRLVSRTVERSGSILWDSLTSEDRYRINHDLQTAFRDAFKEALSDLGGQSCFPEAWISRRDVPARMIYPSTPEANRLWRSRDPLAQQVCDCLNAMRAAVDAQLLLPLDPPHQTPAADVRIYLDAETPEALAGLFFDQVVAPFLASYGTLTAELPTLESHLRLYLLDRTLVHLGELLKARTPAWRAFNRMLLEEVRAGVQEVGSSQVEMLSRLDLLLDRSNLEPLDALSAGLADLLSASGRVEKQLGEGLDTLLQRVAEQHGDVLAHFETLIVLGGRIETKVDRVLRILENGRFIIEGTPSVPVDTPPEPGEPPFKGLQFFDQGDADLFFGRELLTARLIGRLTGALSQAHEDGDAAGLQFLAIIGASGSGKSSVARAGLIPAIKRGETLADGSLPPPGSQEWRVHLITPSAHPLEALAASLTRGKDPVATANLLSSLAADPHSLRLHARQLLDPGNGQPHNDSPPGSQDLLLVVDQFEELFTLCRSEEESKAFIDNLLAACSEQGPVILVITLRADFYQHCAKYENLRAALERRQAYIGPMSREELRCAIEEPALRGEWKFEPGLVDLFLREVGEEPGALPLLSHALLETWKHRRGRAMTLESYAESGGLSGAIAKTAETIFYQQGHTNLVNWVSFGPDGQQVLTASGDQTARLWRLDGMQIGSFQGHTNWVTMAAFSPGGQRIVTTSFDNTLRIWQPDGTLVAELKGHAGWPVMFSFSPDGGRLVSAGWDGVAKIWSLTDGELLGTLSGHTRSVNSVFFSPDGERLLTASYDGTARLWNASSETLGVLQGHTGPVVLAVFSPDGERLLTSSWDSTARLWQSDGAPIAVLQGHTNWVYTAVFNPDGSRILTSSDDGTARLWQLDDLTPEMLVGHSSQVNSVNFSQDGSKIVTAGSDGSARLWSASGKQLLSIEFLRGPANAASLSPDGFRLVIAYYDKAAIISRAIDGKQIAELKGHSEAVSWASYSPNGEMIVTASWDKTARLWQADGTFLRTLEGHTEALNTAVFSPDGSLVLTSSDDFSAPLWELDGSLAATLTGHTAPVHSAVFSPDGQFILTAAYDRTARLWRLDGSLVRNFEGHPDLLSYAAFSPDGALVATASIDGTAWLWQVDGTFIAALEGHRSWVSSLAFSPDGRRLATTSEDSTVVLGIAGLRSRRLGIPKFLELGQRLRLPA